MSVLQVNQLVKSFGRRRVVDGVSLRVNPGEVVGLLGPNGAGKTTTFRMICGLLQPDSGSVVLSGTDVTDWPMFQRARNGGMGYLPQQSSIFAKLTVQQNLLGIMQLLKMDRATSRQRCAELLARFNIEKLARARAGSLSGGERRRLEIARCLVPKPEIIMLDEPFAGIDPVTVQGIQEIITELAATGISILITDHAAREILQITNRTYVVNEGRILCSGTTEEIVRHDEVKSKYLGEIEISQTDGPADRTAPQADSNPETRELETRELEIREPETGQPESGETPSTTDPPPPKSKKLPRSVPATWQSEIPKPTTPRLRVRRPRLPDIPRESTDDEVSAPFRASDIE